MNLPSNSRISTDTFCSCLTLQPDIVVEAAVSGITGVLEKDKVMSEVQDCRDDQFIECIGGAHRRYTAIPPELFLAEQNMATVFTVPPDTAYLMGTSRSVHSEANRSANNTFHKNRSIAVTFKSIELFVTIVTLCTINDEEKLILDRSTQFIFATLGAFIILPLSVMFGLIVGEFSRRLLVGLNYLGTVLFFAVAGLLFCEGRFRDSSIFFSTLAAILYAIDARVSSTMLPTMQVRQRYVRYTHG